MNEIIEKTKQLSNLEILKETLKIFGFYFLDNKLKHIKIRDLKENEISFIDEVTDEKYFAMYTNSHPSYDVYPSHTIADDRFLVQKIEDSKNVSFDGQSKLTFTLK